MKKLANEFIQELNTKKVWLKFSGVALCLVGLISGLLFFSNTTIRFQGFNFIIVSIIFFIHACYFSAKKSGGILIYMLAALFYAFMAIFFMKHFEWLGYIFVLFISAFFILGLYKSYIGFSQVTFNKGWIFLLLAGLFNLVISIFGMYHFSELSRRFLILALYFDILLTGISFIALGTKNRWLNSSW